jgi:hypothetical protein
MYMVKWEKLYALFHYSFTLSAYVYTQPVDRETVKLEIVHVPGFVFEEINYYFSRQKVFVIVIIQERRIGKIFS